MNKYGLANDYFLVETILFVWNLKVCLFEFVQISGWNAVVSACNSQSIYRVVISKVDQIILCRILSP